MNATVARTLYRVAQAVRREPIGRVERELWESQSWPEARLVALQDKRIRALLRYTFEQVPYYRDKWSQAGFRAGDWDATGAIESLPVLEKREIQDHASSMRAPWKGPTLLAKSSGSSGTPVSILRSHESWAHAHTNDARAMCWHGVELGERHAYFWGLALDEKGRREARLKDWFFNRERCSAFGLDRARSEAFYRTLLKRPAAYAFGYPIAMAEFAEELQAMRLDGRALRWRAIFATAEMLHEHHRVLLREVFGCPVVNLYGCAEAGVLGMECERGSMHVPVESVALHWLRDGTADPREVLLTDLHNWAQPLVRYRVGDWVEPASGACPCGRGLPRVTGVVGRAGDTLVMPDGRRVNGHMLGYVFKRHAIAGIVREYQFLQYDRDGHVELRIRPGQGFGDGVAAEIVGEVQRVLGVPVELSVQERLERSPRGKHRDFVRIESPV